MAGTDSKTLVGIERKLRLESRIMQLHALLAATLGDGFEPFSDMESSLRESYLWACSDIAAECIALTNEPEPDREDYRQGATQAHEALCHIVEQESNRRDDEPTIEFYESRCLPSMLKAAGPGASVRARGVICALTEYIARYVASGEPALDVWRPDASYSEAERAQRRRQERDFIGAEV